MKVIHRDLSPGNIMFQYNNELTLKVIDFGLACWDDGQNHIFPDCGTAGFIAPEVFSNKAYSGRVDTFSAGSMIYKM